MRRRPEVVVGLGASAGGLEALERFFDHAPTDSGAAFLVVMHLSRDFRSMLDELLGRHTSMPVVPALDGTQIEADTVYVIQPGAILQLDGTTLRTRKRPARDAQGPATNIDILFRSIAAQWGERGGAVVLSGSGSDGSNGVAAITKAGGFACAQSPETAKFDSMPLAAIATGQVAAVEAAEQLGATVVEGIVLSRRPRPGLPEADSDAAFAKILDAVIGVSTTHAEQYKHSTFERRVRRRMMDLQIDSLQSYVQRIEQDEDEARRLSDALLIGVTKFFRDEAPFELLDRLVIPELIHRAQLDSRPIRVWTPGCATGEEAYTLAILFAEAMRDLPQKVQVQIFATDLKQEYLQQAARGEFSAERLRDIPAGPRDRSFRAVEDTDHWVVSPEIRKMIVFAAHDVLADPPFTRLDMITCRNLLIYLSVEAQQRVLEGFAFGLIDRGFLFLGSSETVAGLREAFEIVDARNRIFRRTGATVRRSIGPYPVEDRRLPLATVASGTRKARDAALMPAYAALLAEFAPPGLLVSESRELMHTFGSARDYLRPPAGIAHFDVAEMVDSALRSPLIAGVERAMKDQREVTFSNIILHRFPEAGRRVDLTVRPLALPAGSGSQAVVLIRDAANQEPSDAEPPGLNLPAETLSAERIVELEHELDRTREALQSTIEEVETANEELMSSNEELMSSNEELSSVNEELSSVNEELWSVNAEYHRQNDELSRLTAGLDSLLESTEIGVVFLDGQRKITRFTGLAGMVFNLAESDLGRKLSSFRSPFLGVELSALLERAEATRDLEEVEVTDAQGRAWLLRALNHSQGRGSVLSLINIERLREAELEARRNAEMLRVVRVMTGAFFVQTDGALAEVERELGFFEFVGADPTSTAFPADTIHPEDWPELQAALLGPQDRVDLVCRLWSAKDREHRSVRLSGRAAGRAERTSWLLSGIDVHAVVQRERAAEEREHVLDAVVRASPNLVSFVGKDARYKYVNPSYEKTWRRPRDEIVGATVHEVLPEALLQRVLPRIEAALTGKRQEFDLDMAAIDGSPRRLSVVYEPVRGPGDEVIGFVAESSDVTRHYERAGRLHEEDQILADALRYAPYPILVVDVETQTVDFANDEARVRLGIDDSDPMPSLRPSRLTPDWGDRGWSDWLRTIEVGAAAVKSETSVFDRALGSTPADIFAAVFEVDGRRKAAIRVFSSQERAAAIQDLRERSRALAISNRDLEQFASVVAHDLRAPLRHIRFFVGSLRDAVDAQSPEEIETELGRIEAGAAKMSDMIQALLDYSWIGRGRRQIEVVDVEGSVSEAREYLSQEIADAKALVKTEGLPEIVADGRLLTRLFQNLLSNALKYADPSRPLEILVDAEVEGSVARIRFSDNGIGIPEEQVERVFELFRRHDPEGSRAGLGIGLTACRRICELHGGKIAIDPTPSEGARFVIELPLEPPDPGDGPRSIPTTGSSGQDRDGVGSERPRA